MAARKTLTEQIEAAQAEIFQKENRLKELRAKQREQERKGRNHRLCKRMGLFEKLMPDTIELTDEQFQAFLEKAVVNDYGKRTLATIAAQNTDNHPQKHSESSLPQSTTTSEKATTPPKNGGTATLPSENNTTRKGS